MKVDLLIALVMATLSKILADEVKEWMAWLPKQLIRWAAKRYPVDLQERLEEEWLAHANDLPGNLTKLGHGLGCCGASLRVTAGRFMGVLGEAMFQMIVRGVFSLIAIFATVAILLMWMRGAWWVVDVNEERARSERLRQAAGGLCLLGINDLDLHPNDITLAIALHARLLKLRILTAYAIRCDVCSRIRYEGKRYARLADYFVGH